MILKRKENYYHHLSLKLNNINTSAKTYWSILKSFYNDTKVALIPPLLVNNKTVSDFTKKANLFNDFFATQCTPLTNSSVLPSTISFKTHSRLNAISFEKEDILKIIRNLNVNKAHGHDDISKRVLKICDSEVVKTLSLIYKNRIDSGIFPDIWKRSHIIPTYKKMINVLLTITVVFLYYQFPAKYLNVLYTILYFYTWKITSCLLHINKAFALMTHASIN